MSEYSATQIPKPRDEQTFECCNEILWRCILRDATVQLHGRRGQRQYGVDLTGIRDDQPENLVGVQCRLKSEGKSLTEDEVRAEVVKALTYSPLLTEYVIVTTAPDDGKLQRLAHQLSISASENREKPLKVRILGWGSLEREIRRYTRASKAFDPSYSPYLERIERKIDALLDIQKPAPVVVPAIVKKEVHTVLEREVNRYAEIVSSDPKSALRLLQQLQTDLDDDVSGEIRFRVAANIAACQFNLADEEDAARGFISAYELAPGNPKAVAHKALGLLISGDWITLKAFAETQFSKQPDNALLAAHYIRGMIADSTVTDPLAQIPTAVRATPQVAEAHILWLMNRGSPGAWWDAAIAAHEAHPGSDALGEIYASALLERIVARVGHLDRQILTEDERTDIDAAIGIYGFLWSQLRDDARRIREEPVSIPINLVVAYRLRNQVEEAMVIANEALARFPGNAHVAKAAASVLMELGDGAQAGALLSEIDIDRETVVMRFGVAMATEDWDTVSDLVDNHMACFSETERESARAARVLIDLKRAPANERRAILKAGLDNFRSDVRASILLARGARECGLESLGSDFFSAALTALKGGDDGLRARLSIANEAMARDKPGTAADMLIGRLPLDRDTFELRLLAQALVYDCPIRQRAIRFFADLHPEVRSLFDFQTSEGILHVNRGAPDDAVDHFSAAFELEASLRSLMRLIGVHQRLGNTDAIAALLRRDEIDILPGSPRAHVDLAHVLLSFGDSTRALKLGYEAVVDGLEHADVVRSFLGLIIKDGMGPVPPQTDALDPVVTTGTWVRLTSERGENYEALVGEDADRPWGARADPSNSFVAKTLGLKIGDAFEHITVSGLRDTWTVRKVKPRWLQAFHYLGKDFGRRFPDAQGFTNIPMPEGDIEPALEQVRRHSEAWSRRAEIYIVKGIPIALAGGDWPGGAIALADFLTSIGEDLRVCYGTEAELSEAHTLIRLNRRSGGVLDAVTAWFAAGLDVLAILRERLGPLAIPRSEFARIQELAVRYGGAPEIETMTLMYQDGQYVGRTITPEDHARRLEEYQSRLAAIEEACAVKSVVIPDDLPESGDELLKVPFGDAFIPAVIARQQKLLLSEDVMMRQVADRVFGTKGVWLQAVLASAVQAETMDWEDYCEAVVQLAAHRHGHVFVGPEVLLTVFERDASEELVKLEALCAYVGSANAEPDAQVELVAVVINAIWTADSFARPKVATATNVLLRAFFLHVDPERRRDLAQALAEKLSEAPATHLTNWLGHGSTPSGSAMEDGSDA